MAYDAGLAYRIREWFPSTFDVQERAMFGGLVFMLNGHMCVGVSGDRLMARVGLPNYSSSLEQTGVSEMDFTGKALRGYVYVDPCVLSEDDALAEWLNLCCDFVGGLVPK